MASRCIIVIVVDCLLYISVDEKNDLNCLVANILLRVIICIKLSSVD